MSNKALFLDRDGTINIDHGYVHTVDKFDFIEGIFDLCREAQNKNYKIIIVTNQSGIDRKYFTTEQVNILHKHMILEFKKNGITINDIFFCSSLDPEHKDRKPNSGMLIKAQKKYNLDMKQSIMVGDKERDILAGINAGCNKNYLFYENSLLSTSKATKVVNKLCDLIKEL